MFESFNNRHACANIAKTKELLNIEKQRKSNILTNIIPELEEKLKSLQARHSKNIRLDKLSLPKSIKENYAFSRIIEGHKVQGNTIPFVVMDDLMPTIKAVMQMVQDKNLSIPTEDIQVKFHQVDGGNFEYYIAVTMFDSDEVHLKRLEKDKNIQALNKVMKYHLDAIAESTEMIEILEKRLQRLQDGLKCS